MNVFSRLRNSSWPGPSCNYQMNGIDIRLGYTNLRGILGGKRTIRYESISDILISIFSGVNKCSQGRNIFVIDFGSSRYQKFVISLIRISAEFPAYNVPSASEETWYVVAKGLQIGVFHSWWVKISQLHNYNLIDSSPKGETLHLLCTMSSVHTIGRHHQRLLLRSNSMRLAKLVL